jgi:hypothetical protein
MNFVISFSELKLAGSMEQTRTVFVDWQFVRCATLSVRLYQLPASRAGPNAKRPLV